MSARIRNQVFDLGQLTLRFLRGGKLCQTRARTIGVLEGSDVLAEQLTGVRTVQSNELAVASIHAKWIQISVQKSAFSFVEHIERFGLVCFHSGNRSREHRLRFVSGAKLTLGESCWRKEKSRG